MPRIIDDFRGDNEFLSNFHGGRKSLEHLYQALKTDSATWKARILAASTPHEAKRLGRQAPIRDTWEDEKLIVMRSLIMQKFRYRSSLSRLLAGTGSAILIEGNWWHDTFWGVCDGTRCRRPHDEPYGENHLGLLLMDQRAALLKA